MQEERGGCEFHEEFLREMRWVLHVNWGKHTERYKKVLFCIEEYGFNGTTPLKYQNLFSST